MLESATQCRISPSVLWCTKEKTHPNTHTEHPVLHAVKPYNERFDSAKWIESDADEQILVYVYAYMHIHI